MPYINAQSGSVPQQKFRSLTVAARFPRHGEVHTKPRKPSRDREREEQLFWHRHEVDLCVAILRTYILHAYIYPLFQLSLQAP